MKCLRQHGERLSRCLAFAVSQWLTGTESAWSNAFSHLHFFIVLVQPFQQLAFCFLCRLSGKSWSLWILFTSPLYIKWPFFLHNLKKICLQTCLIILFVKHDQQYLYLVELLGFWSHVHDFISIHHFVWKVLHLHCYGEGASVDFMCDPVQHKMVLVRWRL